MNPNRYYSVKGLSEMVRTTGFRSGSLVADHWRKTPSYLVGQAGIIAVGDTQQSRADTYLPTYPAITPSRDAIGLNDKALTDTRFELPQLQHPVKILMPLLAEANS